MSSVLKVDEIQNTDGKTGLVITPDGSIDSIKFPEEANPSGRTITSTTMSSFEQGTWNPKLVTGGARFLDAKYVKTNNFVQLRVYVDTIEDKASSDHFLIENLPFTPNPDSEASISACMYRYVTFPNGYRAIVGYLTAGGQIRLYFISDNSNYRQVEHKDLNNPSTNFRFDFTYYTDE